MKLSERFRAVYFSEEPLSPSDYARSRTFSIFEGGTARIIFTLTSGAFLAGFAGYLGASDSFNGIIGAIPVLAGIIQLFSPMVFEKLERRKFITVFLCLLHRILLGLMVFIPFIVPGASAQLATIAGVYFIAYLSVSFINPAGSGWIIDLTPEHMRGKYFGSRESYILAAVTVITLIMGRVMDAFRDAGNEYGGFVVMFSFVLVMSVVNFVFFSLMKEPPVKRKSQTVDIKSVMTIPLKNAGFRKIVILFVLWNIAVQIGGPFFAVYMKTGLKLSYTYIMVMSLLSTAVNLIMVRIWGKIADRKSWAYVTKMSIGILAVCHAIWFFIHPATAYFLVPPMHIMGGLAWAGIGIATFNIQFQYSPEEGRTVYIGFNAALSGVIGFASTLVGSVILSIMGSGKMNFAGLPVGGMQILFLLSGLLLGVCAAYVHFFVKGKEKE